MIITWLRRLNKGLTGAENDPKSEVEAVGVPALHWTLSELAEFCSLTRCTVDLSEFSAWILMRLQRQIPGKLILNIFIM